MSMETINHLIALVPLLSLQEEFAPWQGSTTGVVARALCRAFCTLQYSQRSNPKTKQHAIELRKVLR
jgi:hypothetical protein